MFCKHDWIGSIQQNRGNNATVKHEVLRYNLVGVAFSRAKGIFYLSTLNSYPAVRNNVSYANSLDPDETPSLSASHPDPRCLLLG